MIDWTNPDAGDYWHQQKRLALSKMGITSHWLDLGEPEMYYEHALYYGFPELKKFRHGDIHNVYNFSWAESIFRGYRNPVNAQVLQTALGLHSSPRHFTLSRAGTVGSQRYGGMWSGDVGRNMGNLRAHLNTQMHMSMVGMDYYTSDAGGFSNVDSVETSYNEDSLYTQWFANNCLLDIPLRPHGWANNEQSNNRRFGPDQRGDLKSNLANVRLRYRLTPYLYSLAHHAWSRGEAIFPPLVYHFQGDPLVRRIGNVKMIGKDLLFGVVAGFNQTVRRVYLPQGLWIDFHSLDWYDSHGEETPELQLFRNRDGQTGLFTIPLFARAGAIIPLMHIDKESMNVFGKRSFRPANAQEDEREKILTTQFGVRVFASPVASSFVCCEDDGRTLDYLDGRVRKTLITQQANAQQAHVTVHASQGDFYDALTTRCCVVELITNGQTAQGVTVGGTSLPQLSSQADFDMGKTGWINAGRNRILARSASASVNLQKDFVFEL
jgi:alpha-glucosidase